MGKGIRGVVAGAGAGGVFLLFNLVLGIPLPFSILAAAAGLGGLLLVTRSGNGKAAFPGGQPVAEAVEACAKLEKDLAAVCRDLKSGPVKDRLEGIRALGRKIARDVEQDPKDAREALRFLAYYGDTTVRIATIHRDLEGHGLDASRLQDARSRVLRQLEALEKAFSLELVRLQDDNLLDLDTELKVLEQTMAAEGLDAMIKEEEARHPGNRGSGNSHRTERPWEP